VEQVYVLGLTQVYLQVKKCCACGRHFVICSGHVCDCCTDCVATVCSSCVCSGKYDILVASDGGEPKLVGNYENQGSFGELALMYNTPRAATIVASTEGVLWALVRTATRVLLSHARVHTHTCVTCTHMHMHTHTYTHSLIKTESCQWQ